MDKLEITNGIIINGENHKLVTENVKGCCKCSLFDKCSKSRTFCEVFKDEKSFPVMFVKIEKSLAETEEK